MRSHYNFLEQLVMVCTAILMAGLEFPITACIIGAIYGFSRFLYLLEKRGYGLMPAWISFLLLQILAFIAVIILIVKSYDAGPPSAAVTTPEETTPEATPEASPEATPESTPEATETTDPAQP